MFIGGLPGPVISKVICMFTGIIEGLGSLKRLTTKGADAVIEIQSALDQMEADGTMTQLKEKWKLQ